MENLEEQEVAKITYDDQAWPSSLASKDWNIYAAAPVCISAAKLGDGTHSDDEAALLCCSKEVIDNSMIDEYRMVTLKTIEVGINDGISECKGLLKRYSTQ